MKNEGKGNEKGCLDAVEEMFGEFRNSEHAGKSKNGNETQGGGGYIELRVIRTKTLYADEDTKAGKIDQSPPDEEK